MAAVDAAQAASDWVSGISSKTDKIERGIRAVTVAPGVAAARQADNWLARLNASKEKFKRRVSAVNLGEWQAAAINKGVPRIASGATAAEAKMANFFQKFLPYVEQGRTQLKPRGDYATNVQRMVAMVDHLHKFPGV